MSDKPKLFKKRGRFEIVAVFPSGGSLHITSDKARSLTIPELVTSLRKYADTFERAIGREQKAGTPPETGRR